MHIGTIDLDAAEVLAAVPLPPVSPAVPSGAPGEAAAARIERVGEVARPALEASLGVAVRVALAGPAEGDVRIAALGVAYGLGRCFAALTPSRAWRRGLARAFALGCLREDAEARRRRSAALGAAGGGERR